MSITAKKASEIEVGDSIFIYGYLNEAVSKPETVIEIAPATTSGWVIVRTELSEAHYQNGSPVDHVVAGPTEPVWSWDSSVEAGYLVIQHGEIAHTREVAPRVLIDYDADGNALGVEVL